jgi:hypothetical protein
VASLERDNLEVFYYLNAYEMSLDEQDGLWWLCPYKRGGLWWACPYKKGGLWWVCPYKRGGLWWVCPYKRGGIWWVCPYKRGTTALSNYHSFIFQLCEVVSLDKIE